MNNSITSLEAFFGIPETVSNLDKLKQSVLSKLSALDASVKSFCGSEFTSWYIAREVFTNDSLSQREKLSAIHRAIAEVQELNAAFLDISSLRTDVLIAKRTRDSLHITVLTSTEVAAMFKNKTDKVSFTDKLLLNVDTVLTVIDANWNSIYNLAKWVSGEVAALNRLDSALRLDTQISEIEYREPLLPSLGDIHDTSDAVSKVSLN